MAFLASTLGGGRRPRSRGSGAGPRPSRVAAADPAGQLVGCRRDPRGQRSPVRLGHLVHRVGHRDAGDRVAGVVQHGRRHRREAGGDGAVLVGEAVASYPRELLAQGGQRPGPDAVALHEGGAGREQGPDLRRRQGGEHGQAAGRQVGRQPDPDVGHQRRPAGRALLDDVEHVAPVQHGQVRVVRGRVDQPGEDRPGDPLQRLLPGVRRAQLEGGHAQAVAALLGQVGHEALAAQHRQQVVDARAGQAQVAGDRGGGHRLGMSRDVLQDGEGLPGGGGVGHGPLSQMRDTNDHRWVCSAVAARWNG